MTSPVLRAVVDADAAARVPVPRMRPWVAHLVTADQLDAALDLAGLPLWTSRRGDCPLELSDVPERGHAFALQRGVYVPPLCLTVTGVEGHDAWALTAALGRYAPDAMTDLVRRRLGLRTDGKDRAGHQGRELAMLESNHGHASRRCIRTNIWPRIGRNRDRESG